jgi:hypothetical protein
MGPAPWSTGHVSKNASASLTTAPGSNDPRSDRGIDLLGERPGLPAMPIGLVLGERSTGRAWACAAYQGDQRAGLPSGWHRPSAVTGLSAQSTQASGAVRTQPAQLGHRHKAGPVVARPFFFLCLFFFSFNSLNRWSY